MSGQPCPHCGSEAEVPRGVVDEIEQSIRCALDRALEVTRSEYETNGASARYFAQLAELMTTRDAIRVQRFAGGPFVSPIVKLEVRYGE